MENTQLIIQLYSQKVAELQHQVIVLTAMLEESKAREQASINKSESEK